MRVKGEKKSSAVSLGYAYLPRLQTLTSIHFFLFVVDGHSDSIYQLVLRKKFHISIMWLYFLTFFFCCNGFLIASFDRLSFGSKTFSFSNLSYFNFLKNYFLFHWHYIIYSILGELLKEIKIDKWAKICYHENNLWSNEIGNGSFMGQLLLQRFYILHLNTFLELGAKIVSSCRLDVLYIIRLLMLNWKYYSNKWDN